MTCRPEDPLAGLPAQARIAQRGVELALGEVAIEATAIDLREVAARLLAAVGREDRDDEDAGRPQQRAHAAEIRGVLIGVLVMEAAVVAKPPESLAAPPEPSF